MTWLVTIGLPVAPLTGLLIGSLVVAFGRGVV